MTDESKVVEWHDLWLYAKNWYGKSDRPIDDLKRIIGRDTGTDPRYVTNSDVLQVVYEVAAPYLVVQPTSSLQSFFIVLARLLNISRWGDPITVEDVIEVLLHALWTVRTHDEEGNVLLNLGEPDYTLLPPPAEIEE
jgi:hypothetical protein